MMRLRRSPRGMSKPTSRSLAEAYAPQDGRYKFDFSKVRMTFDEKAVDAAIKTACDKVHAAGATSSRRSIPLIAAKDWDERLQARGLGAGPA